MLQNFNSLVLCYIYTQLICSCTEIKVGLLFNSPESVLDYTHFEPAINIALTEVRKRVEVGSYLNLTISYVLKETTAACEKIGLNIAAGRTVELYLQNDVVAFIGVPCNYHATSTADLAAYWNLPVLTGAGVSSALEDKIRYRTLTRTAYKSVTIAKFLSRVFGFFKWRRCAIIGGKALAYHNQVTVPDLLNAFQGSSITADVFKFDECDKTKLLEMILKEKLRGEMTFAMCI